MFCIVTLLNVRIQFWILSYKVYSMLMIAVSIILNRVENLLLEFKFIEFALEFIAGIQVHWIRIIALFMPNIYIFGIGFCRKNGRQRVRGSRTRWAQFPSMGDGHQGQSVDPWTVPLFDSTWCKWSTNSRCYEVWGLIYYKEPYKPRLEGWVYVGGRSTQVVELPEGKVWIAKDNRLFWGFLWVEPVACPGFQICGRIQPCCS